MNDARLESVLRSLGDAIEVPPVPNLAATVRRRIETEGHAPGPAVDRWSRRRFALATVAAAVAALLVVVTFSPGARRAIADWIGVAGIEIGFDEPPEPVATSLGLGRRVSYEEARELVPFDIVRPRDARLQEPDEVYVEEVFDAVSLVYLPRPGLPETGPFGVAALLTQFDGTLHEGVFQKFIDAGETSVERVEVGGADGYWVEGAPHVLVLVEEDGTERSSGARLAGNTLVWEQDGLTFRLESSLSRSDAVAVAETI